MDANFNLVRSHGVWHLGKQLFEDADGDIVPKETVGLDTILAEPEVNTLINESGVDQKL